MIFPEEVWKIIKSYLMDTNEVNRRLFIKQIKMQSVKENLKWKKVLLMHSICMSEKASESENENDSEED